MPPVTLITGTSTGLGIAIAVQAAQAGHVVYASMRDLGKRSALDKAAQAAGVTLNVLALDVQSTESVAAAVDQILSAEGRIDILVNNAGAGFLRTTEQATETEIDWVMDVNFRGVVRCTKAVLPHMRTARAGRIVTITSVGGLVGQPFNEFYCAAKFAVEGYVESLASYVGPEFGIQFCLVEPGGIATEFARNVLTQIETTGGMRDDAYLPMLQAYVGGAQTRSETGIYQTADAVAQVVLSVMTEATPPLRCRTSDWSEAFCALKTGLDPDGTKQVQAVFDRFLGGR